MGKIISELLLQLKADCVIWECVGAAFKTFILRVVVVVVGVCVCVRMWEGVQMFFFLEFYVSITILKIF